MMLSQPVSVSDLNSRLKGNKHLAHIYIYMADFVTVSCCVLGGSRCDRCELPYNRYRPTVIHITAVADIKET